ncbi:ATP-dependent DNA helicase II subunit 2 [Caenorhabditis elegans]|uniref:ATP-dependent DNA helicase II subunit 2 n=3 Tax=Caenorhabditis elegans TaxID=6239 RepID=Q21829_CAEEL|nr:ATP-dependent DNA helicase II subunit 2 [Caenorhabditis elegans]CAA83623.2 ATP-dependent DNA helicase II subunit 2 [Caenorhabditis elegans]|eukprot:NP_001309438.1 ATP-dependent DNA helicase II subunit 2 [Caenorhabditis elegans]
MPPKKVSPGITVILIDAGSNMSVKDTETGKSAFENAINAADWIVSRKLFSKDPELFSVMAYNLDPKEYKTEVGGQTFNGVQCQNEKFTPASFDHLKFITKELQQNTEMIDPNFFKGVLGAVAVLKDQIESYPNPSGITLIVLTNGLNENIRQENFDLLVEAVSESNADLMIIGIDENPEYPASRVAELAETLEGRTYTFQNVAKMLSTFQARQKSERKYNKMWDIAPGIHLPVIFALKSEKSTALLKFKNADSEGNEMVRLEQMHVETDEVAPKDEFKSPVLEEKPKFQKNFKPVENIKTMHGYNFGKSVIMMDPEYLKEKYNDHNFNEGQTGGVLKLIQFTKRANILDSYLLDASAKTVLPALNSPKSGATKATVSLIEAMLSLRVAAICRYTFHAKSHVQLIALLPHQDEETGVFYLRSVKLPFSDDMRTLKFPKFSFDEEDEDLNKPTVAQLSAVDDLIDCMQLQEDEISSLVEGGMSDPKLQMQCHFLKSLVLHPNDTFENHSNRTNQILDQIMAPKRRVEAEHPEIFQKLGREFNLQPIQKTKRERVTVEPEDLQTMISEWTEKKQNMTQPDEVDDGASQKKKKKPNAKKLTRKEEVQMDIMEDGGASRVCSKILEMISNTCKFQPNGAVTEFFTLLVNELNVIRSVFVENSKCDEFNELLKKLKDEEDFEPFAEVLSEEKSCNPIDSSEVSMSEVSVANAAEFWEED